MRLSKDQILDIFKYVQISKTCIFFHLPVGFPGRDVTPTCGEVEALHLLALGEMLLGTPGYMEAAAGEQRLNIAFSLFQPAQIDLPCAI